MMTLRASGHSARGALRRSAVPASQAMSPCRPSARNWLEIITRAGNGVGGREPDGVEAERLGLVGDGLFQRLCHVAPSFRHKPESRVTCSELWTLDTGFRRYDESKAQKSRSA